MQSHNATPDTNKLICQAYYHYFFCLLVYAVITKQAMKSKSINFHLFIYFLKGTAALLSVTALI